MTADSPVVAGAPGHARTTIWVVLARAISNLAAFALVLMAARVLTPAQFGVFALVSAVAVLLIYIAEAGWEQYIISWVDSDTPPPTVIVCALACGALALGLGAAGAGGIYAWFGDAASSRLLLVLAIPTLPAAFNAVQFATLVRNGKVTRIAKITICAEISGLIAGAWGLHAGLGVFALALAKNVYQFGVLIGALLFARWLPHLEFKADVSRRAVKYSWSVLQTKTIRFATTYGADFLIGAFLGAADVGVYRAGSRIVAAITEGVAEPTRLVALSVLSREFRVRQSIADLKTSSVAITSIVIVLAAPVYLGLGMVANRLVLVMLGPRWTDTAWIVLLLALARLVALPSLLTEPLFCALGRPRVVTRTTVAFSVTSLVSLLALARFGLMGVGVSVLVSGLLFLPVTLWVNQQLGGLPWVPVLRNVRVAALPLLAMAASIDLAGRYAALYLPVWGALALQVGVGIIIYIPLLLITQPAFLMDLQRDVLQFVLHRKDLPRK